MVLNIRKAIAFKRGDKMPIELQEIEERNEYKLALDFIEREELEVLDFLENEFFEEEIN